MTARTEMLLSLSDYLQSQLCIWPRTTTTTNTDKNNDYDNGIDDDDDDNKQVGDMINEIVCGCATENCEVA